MSKLFTERLATVALTKMMADVAPLNAAVLPTIAVPVQRTRNNKPTSFLSVFIPTPWASPTATPCPSPTPKSTGDFTTGIRPVRHRPAQTIMLALSICLAFAVTIKFVFLDRLVRYVKNLIVLWPLHKTRNYTSATWSTSPAKNQVSTLDMAHCSWWPRSASVHRAGQR